VEDSKSGDHALGTGGSVGAKIGQSDPSSEEIFSNSTAFVKRMVRFVSVDIGLCGDLGS
jgi:hypothetical protein